LRNFALVYFEVTAIYLFSKYPLQALIFKMPVFPASAKLAVKYRPVRRNTGHLATLGASARDRIFAKSHGVTEAYRG